MERIIRTFGAKAKGRQLIISVPCETWTTDMRSEEAAEKAAEFIRKNGILCDIDVVNGFLMDC